MLMQCSVAVISNQLLFISTYNRIGHLSAVIKQNQISHWGLLKLYSNIYSTRKYEFYALENNLKC